MVREDSVETAEPYGPTGQTRRSEVFDFKGRCVKNSTGEQTQTHRVVRTENVKFNFHLPKLKH